MTPHPAPEVVYRDALGHEIPTAAKRMMAMAGAAGWAVRPTYARGTTLGRTPKVVDSLALRMRHKGRLATAVAVWTDGKFDFGARQGADLPLKKLGARALAAWLRGDVP